ncbi:hypothetical protein Cci01nite_52370 [Catellatospora citrea]|uniref:Nudix hydrolase domain-containing protein n=1 Tax=Catellatospora citrea TaxID=53366 RepID=A0A8J3KMW4_9ACTN|nr:hypothetical protein Cci01nite_52370 [Catellatospora citrea]
MGRKLFPGAWDIVGGHVEPGETPEDALAREISEETGWQLNRIEAVVADWTWTHDGVVKREVDYLVDIKGDLAAPRLEYGKHDKFGWVGFDNPEMIRTRYDIGNDELWTIIRQATRIRLTGDLRLEPIGSASVDVIHDLSRNDLVTLGGCRLQGSEVPVLATTLGMQWDAGLGYGWLAFRRDVQQQVIGYGILTPRQTSGVRELVMRCAVLPEEQCHAYAVQIVQAMLAFARDELSADRVFAYASLPSQWTREVLTAMGMRPVGAVHPGGINGETFSTSFRRSRSYDD